MKRFLVFATVLMIVVLACAPAFAFEFIVESRNTGQNYGNFSQAGFATSSGNVNAPGCTANIGSMYSGTGSFFGPSRYAQFAFAPTTAGYYEVDLAWTLSAAQINSAVNVYTGNATGGATDRWGNTGGPTGIVYSGTMNMFNNGTSGTGTGVWRKVTTLELSAGTTYKTGIYGGYKTPYAGGVTPADTGANRVVAGAARYMAVTPDKVTAGGLNEYNELSWTAGLYNSGFNVYFGMEGDPLALVGTLDKSTTSMGVDFEGLAAGTYFWRVDSLNVDQVGAGDLYSFTVEAVPEPGGFLALGTGLIGLLGIIRRKRS